MQFGKRISETLTDRVMPSSNFISVNPLNLKCSAVLDFILAHAEGDERPYLSVSILGSSMLGLLDSGASHTIVGGLGWKVIKSLNLPFKDKNTVHCTVANGQDCVGVGSIDIPFQVQDRIKIVNTLVIPSISHALILGADFWRQMGIVPDLRHGSWTFSSNTVIVDSVALHSQSELVSDQLSKLNSLVSDAFQNMGNSLGCTTLVEHEIKTASAPIKQRYYPVSPVMQSHINRELDKLLEQDIVERSNSPWSSPILLVRKKDNSYRFCVDYRKLNQCTERDAYPLPYVSATLDRLRDARYLSSLDIKSAYFQVPLTEASRPLTAFTVPNRGLFQFRRLPMGLANSPATFQRLIDRVLGADLEPYVFCYLDDIIIVTQTFDKHLEILTEVFKRLKTAGLTVAKEKCFFCRSELKYLGYIVDRNGLRVDPDKISAILNIPVPTCVSEVRRIIGLASWYRRFVPNFSALTAPLCNLLRKNKKFIWDDSCDESFRLLKEHLISAPVLSCPDFSLPFTIQTDASGYGIGAVLSQQQDGAEKVICYLSRSLNRNERNFSTTERECLAVLWAIERLRPYIEGSHFTVVTDHHSLVWLNRLQTPSGRLARWAIKLQQYDYHIIHRKGKDHIVPDTLSRSVPIIDTINVSVPTRVTKESVKDTDLCSDQSEFLDIGDKWYMKLIQQVQNKPSKFPQWRISGKHLYKYIKVRYPELAQDADYWRLVVPRSERQKLVRETHDLLCHAGSYKTFHKLAEVYYWPKMRYDVAAFIRYCKTCLSVKPEQKRPSGLMLSAQTTVSQPFELLCADLVGPLPKSCSGFQYILVVADCFSKFPLLFPLRVATASNVCKAIEDHVFLMFGSPKAIIVDNGVQFRSKEFTKLMNAYKVSVKYTALYHPQANPCERINRVIKTMLRCYVSDNHRTWDKHLPRVASAIRSAKHEITGLTPNFIVFGRELPTQCNTVTLNDPISFDRTTIDEERTNGFNRVYLDVQKRLARAYSHSKSNYDLRRRNQQFLPNDQVWRRNYIQSDSSKYFAAKLAPRFLGPFRVVKRLSPWTYELADSENKYSGVWHAKDLKSHPPDHNDDLE